MPQYHVDSEHILSASTQVNASIEDIRAAVSTMYAHLTELESSWQGSAAIQFQTVAQQWQAAQRTMEDSLTSIQHAMTQAAQLYADTEAQASQLFAQ
ncbi:WXG100 family type VII secretion target [Alloscardovia omnicolens]|uniref:WXG100 family type VII secretion target n=1 Tax=Alloscardovia omnicolens TaxID=419015 RepID=UPI003A741FAF